MSGTSATDNVLTHELIRAGGLGGGIGSVLYDDNPGGDPDSVEFFVYNAVGSTVALSDYSSAVTQSNVYEAFGQTVATSGTSTNNRLRNTKERDSSLGLDNDGMRYYDPATGRYVQRDPIGYGDGMNVYVSVHNNPVNNVDPLGLFTSYITDFVADHIASPMTNFVANQIERVSPTAAGIYRVTTGTEINFGKDLSRAIDVPRALSEIPGAIGADYSANRSNGLGVANSAAQATLYHTPILSMVPQAAEAISGEGIQGVNQGQPISGVNRLATGFGILGQVSLLGAGAAAKPAGTGAAAGEVAAGKGIAPDNSTAYYHGTDVNSAADIRLMGPRENAVTKGGVDSRGLFVTPNKSIAESYAKSRQGTTIGDNGPGVVLKTTENKVGNFLKGTNDASEAYIPKESYKDLPPKAFERDN